MSDFLRTDNIAVVPSHCSVKQNIQILIFLLHVLVLLAEPWNEMYTFLGYLQNCYAYVGNFCSLIIAEAAVHCKLLLLTECSI